MVLFVCLLIQQKVIDNDKRSSQLSPTTVQPLLQQVVDNDQRSSRSSVPTIAHCTGRRSLTMIRLVDCWHPSSTNGSSRRWLMMTRGVVNYQHSSSVCSFSRKLLTMTKEVVNCQQPPSDHCSSRSLIMTRVVDCQCPPSAHCSNIKDGQSSWLLALFVWLFLQQKVIDNNKKWSSTITAPAWLPEVLVSTICTCGQAKTAHTIPMQLSCNYRYESSLIHCLCLTIAPADGW